jgi:hypothetical protein
LIHGIEADHLLADKGYDTNEAVPKFSTPESWKE